MCTVSVVAHHEGFRVVCNRDERHDRPAAVSPAWRELARHAALFPVDPVGGGTWIGVNEAGLVAALLNGTRDRAVAVPRGPRSRGLVTLAALDCANVAQAVGKIAQLAPADFGLFRLLLVSASSCAVITSDGQRLSITHPDSRGPTLLTSSSLGDRVVGGPRRRLFNRLFRRADGSLLDTQRRFHDHQWPLHKDISVRMERPEARTVSRTTIDVGAREARLVYEPFGDESRERDGLAA